MAGIHPTTLHASPEVPKSSVLPLKSHEKEEVIQKVTHDILLSPSSSDYSTSLTSPASGILDRQNIYLADGSKINKSIFYKIKQKMDFLHDVFPDAFNDLVTYVKFPNSFSFSYKNSMEILITGRECSLTRLMKEGVLNVNGYLSPDIKNFIRNNVTIKEEEECYGITGVVIRCKLTPDFSETLSKKKEKETEF